MGVFNNFPYANFHELNADWIIEQVRKVMDDWEEYKTDMNLWKLGVDDQLAEFQAWFDNLDVQDEVRTVINELIQSGEFIEIAGPQIVSATEAWLAAHITPTTPAVDDTLSISGAAADAKVTGDRITDLKEDIGGFKWTKTAVSRFIDIPIAASAGDVMYFKPIVWTGDAVANFTFTGIKNGVFTVLTTVKSLNDEIFYTLQSDYDSFRVSASTAVAPSTTQTLTVLCSNLNGHNNIAGVALKNKIDLIDYIPYKLYNGAFTTQEQLNSGITLNGGTTYIIRCKSSVTGRINVYCSSSTSNYKAFTPWRDTIRLSVGSTGNLMFYNPESTLDALDIVVYEEGNKIPKINQVPSIYVVDKLHAQNGDYTSLTDCLLALKNDDSPKIIYINGGDYDIHQEYVNANVPIYTGSDPAQDYWDYNVWIPKNTHIIGRGIVRLMWMPDASDITINQSKTVSPVNAAGSMILENVEIHCKNGRYCIHDDPNGQIEYTNAIKKYINVKCYKYANDTGYGFAPVIGFGLDNSMHYEFENCLLKNLGNERAFYAHTRGTVGGYTLNEYQSSDIVVNNCILDSGTYTTIAKLGNAGDNNNLHIRMNFNNCSFNNNVRCFIQAINESGSSPINPNAFDITLNRCSPNAEVYITDPSNLYPPTIVQ